jgi:methanogenic corrinoid protein MtbC1
MDQSIGILKGHIVSQDTVNAFTKYAQQMVEKMNENMFQLNKEFELIGRNPISMMYDNHSNHVEFMKTVFELNDYEMLYNTMFWVFSSYESKGFKSYYFDYALVEWVKIFEDFLQPPHVEELKKVYQWMLEVKPQIEKELETYNMEPIYPYEVDWKITKDKFLHHLMMTQSKEAMELAKSVIIDVESLKDFYVKVITYTLYQVGFLWQKGEISITREHLITSMIMRIMSSLYMEFVMVEQDKGKAFIAASSQERHEIGARILADMLELDGWDTYFLGADIPNEDLIKQLELEKPAVLALSITMSANIDHAIKLVQKIRTIESLKHMRIMMGGSAFSYSSIGIMKIDGVDAIISNVNEAIKIVNEWWWDKNE